MVTPAAPRSRITSAALISIFVRVSQRFVGAGSGFVASGVSVAVGTFVPALVRVMQRASAAVGASGYYVG